MLTGGHGPFRGRVAPLALDLEHIDKDESRQPMTENQVPITDDSGRHRAQASRVVSGG
jgi:hypothetical protein